MIRVTARQRRKAIALAATVAIYSLIGLTLVACALSGS